MNSGLVSRVAPSAVKDTPPLEMATNSLTLLPEARAVKNKVFSNTCCGDELSRLKSSLASFSSTRSIDHFGVLRFCGGFDRNWCLAKSEKASEFKSRLNANWNGCLSLDL